MVAPIAAISSRNGMTNHQVDQKPSPSNFSVFSTGFEVMGYSVVVVVDVVVVVSRLVGTTTTVGFVV